MFYIFLELPYEHQLKKINSDIVENFKTEIKQEAINNGCNFFICHTCFGCTIDASQLAALYSVSRFLFNIKNIFHKYSDKIKEIRCIIKYYDSAKQFDEYADLFFEFKKQIIPDFGIYTFEDVAKKLEKYIKFQKISNDLYLCSNFIFFEKKDDQNAVINNPSIIVHKTDNYFWSLYNFLLLNPLSEDDINLFSENDKESFYSTQYVFRYLKKYRFSKEMPQYFIDAFLLNVGIYLKNFIKIKNNHEPLNILVDNLKDDKNFEEANKILRVNKSAFIHNFVTDMPSIYSIPEDLLELIYIILLGGKYFFYDELSEFLLTLNKSVDFFDDIYDWLYSSKLIFIKKNIYAIKYGLLEIIERRIGDKKKNLDLCIANFLWKKYKQGDLFPDSESESIFNSLNFQIKSDFLISSIFHKFSNYLIEGLDLKKYRNESFYDSLKYYQNALLAQNDGSTGKAYPLAKTSLISFQDYNLVSGEYRALSLLAFFNLSENKIADALTYFLYSLDNAEQINDSSFICEALFNISIAYFLDNNLKQSMTFLDKLSDSVSIYFEQKWKIPCLFMQARIYLQIGEFENAKKIFNLAGDFAELYFEDLVPMCRVWSARALLYMGEIKKAQVVFNNFIDDTDDSLLFLLESNLFYPKINNGFNNLELNLDNIYSDYSAISFDDPKKIKSGFSFVEDLVWYNIYGCSVGKKLFIGFYNYYSYKLNFFGVDKKLCKKYLSELEALAIDSLYQKEPFSSLYLFFCYELYSISSGETSSTTTAYLSKAFKAMQKAVLNIGENNIRDKYMTKNIWNQKLFKVAKEHKLI